MAKAIDLTGEKFNYLTVLERDYDIQKQHPNERVAWWKCKCKCGNYISVRGSSLRKGNTSSCGCYMKEQSIKAIRQSNKVLQQCLKMSQNNKLNLIGQKFTKLTVLEEADAQHQIYYNNKHKITWKCLCDCGNICYITTENLRGGKTKSCGCITKENRKAQLKDLTGQRFGHLLVLKYLGTFNRNSKYLVKCDCGKEYEIYSQNLTQGKTTSCGCVKESHGENKIRKILINNKIKFINQKSFSDFIYNDTKKKPRYDFYLPDYNILIEYDGEQHFKQITNWDTTIESFKKRQEKDKIKNNYALKNNYILIRIPYTHFNNINIDDLLSNSAFIVKEE